MHRDLIRQAINVAAVVLTVVVNGLANGLPLNGQKTGEISDRFPVFFVPAGYVFAIWGLIYLGLVAFAVYQALPAQRTNERLRRMGYWFALSCLANSAWIFCWHYNLFPLSLGVMLVVLTSLVMIYLGLAGSRARAGTLERWSVDVPFSVYLGWITVATVANATDVLYYLKWSGWGIASEVWGVLLILAATAICLAVVFTQHDAGYALVLVWALAGIAVKQGSRSQIVSAGAVATAVVILAVLLVMQGRHVLGRRSGRAAE